MGRKHMTEFEKGQIIGMAATHKPSSIASLLKRDKRTVQRFLNEFKKTGSPQRKPGSGRKRATTPKVDRLIKRVAIRDRRVSSTEIKEDLGLEVSTKTVRNRLHEMGLKCYWSSKKPFVNDKTGPKSISTGH